MCTNFKSVYNIMGFVFLSIFVINFYKLCTVTRLKVFIVLCGLCEQRLLTQVVTVTAYLLSCNNILINNRRYFGFGDAQTRK